QRHPSQWPLGQKCESQGNVEDQPPYHQAPGATIWPIRRPQPVRYQFVSSPIGTGHKKNQPHVRDSGFCVDEHLKTKSKNNCGPPTNSFVCQAFTPRKEQKSGQRCCYRRRKTSCKIVFAKQVIT